MSSMNNIPRPGDVSHKEYFLRYDNLENITKEIIFSAFRRYNCLAGCKVCYTDHLFAKNDPAFGRFIPTGFDSRYNELLFDNVFPYFYSHSTIDDLYWCYHKHRHIYDWYVANQKHFVFGNMTDNNFIRTQPLLMRDFHDSRIYEITFSDDWLNIIRNRDLVQMLDELHNQLPITKIKMIQKRREFDHPVLQWARDNGVGISRHYDVMNSDTMELDSEQTLNFCSENGYIFTVCGESDYLQYDSFFLTLVDAIDANEEPYDTLWDPVKHLSQSLHAKKKLYTKYVDMLKDSTNPITLRYRDYFQWYCEHVHVNDDFTFIPIVALNKWNKYYEQLSKSWIETEYGLLKPNEKPKPLYTISD